MCPLFSLGIFLYSEASSTTLTVPQQVGIDSVYSEVIYSEVEDNTVSPYELPVTRHRAPPAYEFQDCKGGLQLQIVEDERSLRRESGATINQPALDQEVQDCVCACVCICVCCINACVCVCACMCVHVGRFVVTSFCQVSHVCLIYPILQDCYTGWVVPTMVGACVCLCVHCVFVMHCSIHATLLASTCILSEIQKHLTRKSTHTHLICGSALTHPLAYL